MTPLMKAVVFCFCPELLPDTEGGHVSHTKQEGAVLISSAFLLMRSSYHGSYHILINKRARVSLTLRLTCVYFLRSLLSFLTFIL